MKTVGLLGGMSWESTLTYYKVINETVNAKLGGLHSAKVLLHSVDFDEIERLQSAGQWDRIASILTAAAGQLEAGGADFIVLCSNTAHRVAPEIRESVRIPLLHIAEVTARRLKEAGITTAGLLGTRYTMTQPFYRDVLARAGIQVLIPGAAETETVDKIIFDELCSGLVLPASKQAVLRSIGHLRSCGAQCVVLGCTELGLLVGPDDVDIPVFDTALIHAGEAALLSLGLVPEEGSF